LELYKQLPDSVNNQTYYVKDLPCKPKGKVKINISHVPAGNYMLEIYKVGYCVIESANVAIFGNGGSHGSSVITISFKK